jgi:hypothetical protein
LKNNDLGRGFKIKILRFLRRRRFRLHEMTLGDAPDARKGAQNEKSALPEGSARKKNRQETAKLEAEASTKGKDAAGERGLRTAEAGCSDIGYDAGWVEIQGVEHVVEIEANFGFCILAKHRRLR